MDAKKFRNNLNNLLLSICRKMSDIADFSSRHPWKIITSFLAITLILAMGMPRIQMDQSMDSFFEDDSPVLVNYKIFKKFFGSDEVQVILYEDKNSKDVFSPAALKKLKLVEDEINKERLKENSPLNRITRVRTLLTADVLEAKNNSLISKSFIGDALPETEEASDKYRKLALKEESIIPVYASENLKYGMIVIKTNYGTREVTEDGDLVANQKIVDDFDFAASEHESISFTETKAPNYEKQDMLQYSPFVQEIEKILLKHGWGLAKQIYPSEEKADAPSGVEATLNGNPWVMSFFMDLVMKDISMFNVLCFLLILFCLFFSFGSFSSLIWPAFIIVLSIIDTMGIIGWSGVRVNMMISIVSFLIVTVGVASIIHIYSGYYQYMRDGVEKVEALKKAMYKSGLSILFANLTTMAGMLSLSIVDIPPIANFAWFAAVGVLMAFIHSIFLLPALLCIWSSKIKKGENQEVKGFRNSFNNKLRACLITMATLGIERRKTVIGVFAFLSIFVFMGLPKIQINTNFVEMIKKGNGMWESYKIIDDNFAGTSNIELIVDTGKQNGLHDPKILNSLENIEKQVLNQHSDFIKRTDSIVKITKDSYQKFTDGSSANYKIPQDKNTVAQVLSLFESADPDSRRFVVDDNWQMARVTLNGISKGTKEYEDLTDDVIKIANDNLEQLKPEYPRLELSITGNIPLAMELISFISNAQFQSFSMALIVICILLIFVYGSFRFGFLALIPNLFPILGILSLAGWAGIYFDSDTLLVIPIAIGIVVDDTIHFLTHFRTRLLEGASRKQAILDSARDVGQAMFTTSFILTLGFMVFLFSIYVPFNNFGILAAFGIFAAFFADMILLPALLMTFNVFGVKDEL